MAGPAKGGLKNDLLGGLAAMLVALPSAMAYGLVAYAPLGGAAAAGGAVAGLVGAMVLGLIAPLLGGTPRLVSAPCAPAAAVLATVSAGAMSTSTGASPVVVLMLVAFFAGALQILFALLRGGRLIKFIPYPVVAGYLSGVGALIFVGQVPKALGWPRGVDPWTALVTPSLWQGRALLVALVTVVAMLLAPRITKALPAPIIGLAAGALPCLGLVLFDPQWPTAGRALLLGDVGDLGLPAVLAAAGTHLREVASLPAATFVALAGPAATLAVLLSVDTLKTCVVLDTLTRSRHDSNRELRGQGVANVCSALLGGMPGAGTMGATVVNLASGGTTRVSSVATGGFAVLVFLALSPLIAWLPLPSLAGILLVVGARMIDAHTFSLLRDRSTLLDFGVIASVVATALLANLLAAAGVGVGLAIILFLRDQVRGTVVRRRLEGGQRLSKKRRLPEEVAVLEQGLRSAVVLELQGSLFFGTTDQLYTELEADLARCTFVMLDLRRVSSVDLTAVHLLEQIGDSLGERGGTLVLSSVPAARPTRRDLPSYLESTGLTQDGRHIRLFATLDDGLAWVEDQVIYKALPPRGLDKPMDLGEIELFRGATPDVLELLQPLLRERVLMRDEMLFRARDDGDDICFVRRGYVRIQLDLGPARTLHLATFGPGDHFGELAFIDHLPRSADAVARCEVSLYVLSRADFDRLAEQEPRLLQLVLGGLARSLAQRLRLTDRQLQAAEED